MDYTEEEINLIDYIRVIMKRRQLIFALFLAGLVIGWGFYFLMPGKYEAKLILDVGFFIGEKDSTYQLIEDPQQAAEKIESGFYGDYPEIKAEAIKGTNLIKIEMFGQNPKEAKEVLENIKEAVLAEHNEKLEARKEILKREKSKYEGLIAGHNNLIENIEKSIFSLKKDITRLISKNQQIVSLQIKIYDLQLEIYSLQNKIYELQSEMEKIQKKIESFQATKTVGEITISKKEINLFFDLIVAGLLGIFLGVVLAFAKEWWDKNKARMQL